MPELTDDRLIDDLRRYGEATEEAAGRRAAPVVECPVTTLVRDLSEPASPSGRPSRRRRPVAVLAAAAGAVVLVVAVVAVVVVRRGEASSPVVDTPSTSVVPAAEPFDDGTVLMWLPYEGAPQFLPAGESRPLPRYLGSATTTGCCGVATVNTAAAFLAGGTLHVVDRSGRVDDTGISGERVVADRQAGAFYVQRGGQLARLPLSGARPLPASTDGEWSIPAGWQLPNDGSTAEALDGRVIVERAGLTSADQAIALWTLATGELRTIGTARWVVDATTYPDGVPIVAWVGGDCDLESTGCGLVITNLDTMESRTVARPEHGYIGGGAFSDDGRHLAVFVAGQARMTMDPSTDLAVVDVDTSAMRLLPGTNVPVGEPYGSAAWTLDGSSVVFHGLSETRVVDITTGDQRTLPWDITYAMATIP